MFKPLHRRERSEDPEAENKKANSTIPTAGYSTQNLEDGRGGELSTSSLLHKVSEILYWPAKSHPSPVSLTNNSSTCSKSWSETTYPIIRKCPICPIRLQKKFWIPGWWFRLDHFHSLSLKSAFPPVSSIVTHLPASSWHDNIILKIFKCSSQHRKMFLFQTNNFYPCFCHFWYFQTP